MYERFQSLPIPLPLTHTQLQISVGTIFLFGSLRCRTANFRRNHFRLGAHESRIVQASTERGRERESETNGTIVAQVEPQFIKCHTNEFYVHPQHTHTHIRICIRTRSVGSHSYSYRFSVNFSQAFSGDLNVTHSRIRYAFAVEHQVSSASECRGSATNRCDTHTILISKHEIYSISFSCIIVGSWMLLLLLSSIMAITLRPYRHNQRQCEA